MALSNRQKIKLAKQLGKQEVDIGAWAQRERGPKGPKCPGCHQAYDKMSDRTLATHYAKGNWNGCTND